MKYLRILWLFLAILSGCPVFAQFNPANPPEPSEPSRPVVKYTLTLISLPADASSILSGGGVYEPGKSITLKATAKSGFSFIDWEDAEGKVLTTASSYSYIMPERDVTIYARYNYSPVNPSEPSQPEEKGERKTVTISVSPADGGNATGAGQYEVGTVITLNASSASKFKFVNWTKSGKIISTDSKFNYTVEEEDNALTVNFHYTPSSPEEPAQPTVPVKKSKLFLRVRPSDSGRISPASGESYEVGGTVTLKAYNNDNFKFVSWTSEDGEIISETSSFNYVVSDRDVTLTANFAYVPSSPSEPAEKSPQRNVIYGGRHSVTPGAEIFYDVNMENVDLITGMNIDIAMPSGFSADYSKAVTTQRTSSHTISTQPVNDSTWRIFVRGESNFGGGSGSIIRIPVKIPSNVDFGSIYEVDMSHGVKVAADGSQTPLETVNGILKIIDADISIVNSPDFAVSSLSTPEVWVNPGDNFSLSWNVINQGNMDATGGWTETVSLVSSDNRRTVLSTLYYNTNILKPGESVSRSADVTIPLLPGIDGDLHVRIDISPSSAAGEADENKFNNILVSDNTPVHLTKMLSMTVPESLEEGEAAQASVSRSGDWSKAESFNLTKLSGDSRLKMPATVLIPRNQASAYFIISALDNNEVDDSDDFVISVEGNGYEAVKSDFHIIDNESLELSVTPSVPEIWENEHFNLLISIPRKLDVPLNIEIASIKPHRFRYPKTVTIPAGEKSIVVEVEGVDNSEIDFDDYVEFVVSAKDYSKGICEVLIKDNDVPVIEMTLSQTEVMEDAGASAVIATILRTSNIDKKVTLKLVDDASKREIQYPNNTYVMPAGVASIDIPLSIIDNKDVDGDRKIQITAYIYASSCSCSSLGTGIGEVTRELSILDNDGQALSLSSKSAVLLEGGKPVEFTVERNTETSVPLVVTITSDNDEGLEYQHEITIAAGKKTAEFKVSASKNKVADDDRIIVFKAEAEGFSKGLCTVMLTNQSLPDAKINDISFSADKVVSGEEVEICVKVANMGSATLSDAMEINVYKSGIESPVCVFYTDTEINEGDSKDFKKHFNIPVGIGSHYYYAVVNEKKKEKETSYSNNTSGKIKLTAISPFSPSISTEKKIYKNGEEVVIKGKLAGKNIADARVEVYIINGSIRDKKYVISDSNGEFTLTYMPVGNLYGHFSVGACFPGENLTHEQDYFDIHGLSIENITSSTVKAYKDEEYKGYLSLKNNGTLPLSGVKVNVTSKPEGVKLNIDCPETIGGKETVKLNYTLTPYKLSEGDEWDNLSFEIITSEGVSIQKKLYYYCYNQEGTLIPDIDKIKATVVKDSSREISFDITNIGKGETGIITLSMPSWMSSLTPIEMQSLQNEECATVVLKITPKPDWELNIPVNGSIGVNCSNGKGFSLPFTIEPVSENMGKLVVDVCDEYTYYTKEAPHVSDAEITVCHPVTGALIAQGSTGEDGLYSIDLPEGWYKVKVSHINHDSYSNNIYVEPGINTNVNVDLSISAVKISYTVEETEIEDEYEIVTSYTYETNVPVPVVTVTQQGEINGDEMEPGESRLIYLLFTNHGLITANEFEISKISAEGWEFTYLVDEYPEEIPAKSTFTLPVLITRTAETSIPTRGESTLSDSDNDNPPMACITGMSYWYKWVCGKEIKTNKSAYLLAIKKCAVATILGGTIGSWTPSIGGGGGLGGAPNDGNQKYPKGPIDSKRKKEPYIIKDPGNPIVRQPSLCNPDYSDCGNEIFNNLMGSLPVIGTFIGITNTLFDIIYGAKVEGRKITPKELGTLLFEVGRSFGGLFFPVANINKAWDLISIARSCSNFLSGRDNKNRSTRSEDLEYVSGSWGESVIDYATQLELSGKIDSELFGNDIWLEVPGDQLSILSEAIENISEDDFLDFEVLLPYKPDCVSKAEFQALLERINRANSENTIDLDAIKMYLDQVVDIENKAIEAGFESSADKCRQHLLKAYEAMNDPSGNVCSKVKLEISQSMVMTRQAFRGTLTIENGSNENHIRDVKLMLTIINKDGEIATSHEFQTSLETLLGFKGEMALETGWNLSPKETGIATILFIPTKYAAPDTPQEYLFGGSISYVDPYTGFDMTRELSPTSLTVKPSPNLDLTYFMQRDIYGDDPLTPNIIEESVPAEFALVINNAGNGDASNVRMVTNQPTIKENEKGLLIDFELLGGLVNGVDKNLAFGSHILTEFGDIPSHSSVYAQWWLQSSLLGHFSEYDVSVNHLSSYGNEDLSLLNNVSIHELIHGFTVDDSSEVPLRGFLVNDVADLEEMPDRIYFSNADENMEVAVASEISMKKLSDTQCRVYMKPSYSGWNYAKTEDKTSGKRLLISAVRESDGMYVPTDNFWFTDRTMRDNLSPVNEKLCHMVTYSEAPDSWLLTFEERPDKELDIETFFNLPDESEVGNEPVLKVGIRFNKPIKEESFTIDDVSLYCQGIRVDISNSSVNKISEREYYINLNGVTDKSGYYVFTVMTQGIIDEEGFNGLHGRSISWMQNLESYVDMLYITDKGSLRIYPKPMKDILYTSGEFDVIEEISFYDIAGRLKLRKGNIIKGESIDISSLTQGVYIIKVETDKGVFIDKSIKE